MIEAIIDESFTEIGKEYIKRTISIFEHFEIAKNSGDFKWIKIDGNVFGSDLSAFNYYLHKYCDSFSVQLCSKKSASGMSYMFGVVFFEENGEKKARAYHHGHSPFNIYECEYEK